MSEMMTAIYCSLPGVILLVSIVWIMITFGAISSLND